MHDVRSMPMRNNAIGRGAYASTTGAGVAEELFDEDGFSYKELLQEYSGDQKKSSKRQSDSNRNRQQDNNHSQSLSLRSYSKRNTASASELLNGLALKNNAYIQTIGTEASLSNIKLSSSESNAKSEDMSTNKVVSEVDTLSPDSDVYFKDVTVMRSAPSEANRENWLAGYAGKATLVSTAEVDGVQWATIKTGSGKLAYVRADELSATNPLVTATGSRDKRNLDIGTMLGVRNAVKLYKDTDEQSDYSGAYGDETGMEVLERTIKNGEEWLKVKTYSNDVGWCKAEQLCPLKEKLHTINNPSGDGYKLNLNVGTIPRSMIPSNLNIDADGNIECKISAAYLKNSINAHVFYDESGIAHGTRGAEAFDLSELDKTDIVGTAGFTPDGWVNFKLSDGRTITINMADLNPIQEISDTNIKGDIDNDGLVDKVDENLHDDYVEEKTKDIYNDGIDDDGHVDEPYIPVRETAIEDIVDKKIENAQKKINIIRENEMQWLTDGNYSYDRIGKIYSDDYVDYSGRGIECCIYKPSGDMLIEMYYQKVAIINGINISNSAYLNIEKDQNTNIYNIYPVDDECGLNIKYDGNQYNNNTINIYGSDNNDYIVFRSTSSNITYYAGYGENTINIDSWGPGLEGANKKIYATQGINTIILKDDWFGKNKNLYIKGGGVNIYHLFPDSNVKIEDFSEDDTIILQCATNYYDIRLSYGKNGELNIEEFDGKDYSTIASLTGNVDLNGKIEYTNLSGKKYEMTIADLIAPVGKKIQIEKLWAGERYTDKQTNTTIQLENEHGYITVHGYKFAEDVKLSEVEITDTDIEQLNINNAQNLLVTGEIANCKGNLFYLDGSASISVSDRKMLIKTEDNVLIDVIDNDATVMTKEGDNKIRLEGKNNILYMGNGNNELEITNEKAKVTTSGGTNKIDIRGKEAQIVLSGGSNDIEVFDKSAHIHCGNGEDGITVKSTGTTISNFDFDKDKLNFGSYSELEADVQGRSIVVRGKDSNSEDFVVSLLGTTDIDKIQKLIEEHNENVQKDEMSRKLTESYDSLENSLAEKIGTAIKNDVEPVFEAKDALKQIDKIGKIEGNTHLPQNVIDRYKEYIAESMANSAITADDLTNTERIVNSWASIFGDNKEIPIGEYTIVPTSISYNGIGAFKADVKKDGKYVTTLYMANLDNKALSEAVTDFIAAGQKVYKSKLNEAIKSYVDEVGDAFGVNLGEAYDVGVGVINLLSGGDAGKSKFSEMLNSFGQKNVAKIIERTFGREGKNMVKAVKSLKEAKDNIDTAINTANLTDYEKITGLLNATAKLIGKL